MKAKLVVVIAIFLSIVAFLALSRRQQNAQVAREYNENRNHEYSVIDGVVVDKNDRPVSYMPVRADPKGASRGELRESATDKQGKFVITGIRYGTYLVRAGKSKEGYPWMTGTFYMNEDDGQTVVVTKEKKGYARVVLGERLGRIIGAVKDAKGKPVQIAVIKLTVAGSNPERSYQTTIEDDGSFVVPVPPEPVVLEAFADGYETFKSEGLNVSHGAVKKLRIRLRRSH